MISTLVKTNENTKTSMINKENNLKINNANNCMESPKVKNENEKNENLI